MTDIPKGTPKYYSGGGGGGGGGLNYGLLYKYSSLARIGPNKTPQNITDKGNQLSIYTLHTVQVILVENNSGESHQLVVQNENPFE